MSSDDQSVITPVAEQTEENQARADVYRLLAALLVSPPKDELLNIIRSIDVEASNDDASLTNAWQMLKQAAQQIQVDQLEDEFFNLFIGLGKSELTPYASWYLTGFLMEKPLAELRAELSRLGFLRQSNVREPEDHVAALCEVMAVIIAECVLSFDEEKQFFNRNIEPWMGHFFDDLCNAQSSSFYQSVGQLGEQFIDIEKQYFSMQM